MAIGIQTEENQVTQELPEQERPTREIPQDQEIFPNLAKKLSEERLLEIGNEVVEGFKIDKQSRSKWEERHATWLKLFGLQTEPKVFPWEGASNVALPVMTTACLQFQARAYEALIPAKNIVKIVPIVGLSGWWDDCNCCNVLNAPLMLDI